MVELERNPMAVRQGAAAVACIAAAAVAMPVISHRAADQREGAEWSARQLAFQAQMQQRAGSDAGPDARIQLASYRTNDGIRARGSAFVVGNGMEGQALLVHAALRGPLAAPPITNVPDVGAEALNQGELRCLSEAIFYEARGESYRGQVAVAQVVMNRVRSKHYPNSICGVVYQGHQRATGCQFTFTCDGSLNRRPRGRAWERAQNIAAQVMLGYTRSVVGGSTHYHTTAVNPVWSAMLVRTTQVGDHLFYRFPSRSERAVLAAAYDRRRASAADLNAAEEIVPPEAFAPDAADEDIAGAETIAVSNTRSQSNPSRIQGVLPANAAQEEPAKDEPVGHGAVEAVPPPPENVHAAAVEVAT
ncbi:MAG: cell wall hydrolase [Hyphomonadaceae bacterium]